MTAKRAKKFCGVTYNARMIVSFAKYLINILNIQPSMLSIDDIHQLVIKDECKAARESAEAAFILDLETLLPYLSSSSFEVIIFKVLVSKVINS